MVGGGERRTGGGEGVEDHVFSERQRRWNQLPEKRLGLERRRKVPFRGVRRVRRQDVLERLALRNAPQASGSPLAEIVLNAALEPLAETAATVRPRGITVTPENSSCAFFGRSPPRIVMTSRVTTPRFTSPASASAAAASTCARRTREAVARRRWGLREACAAPSPSIRRAVTMALQARRRFIQQSSRPRLTVGDHRCRRNGVHGCPGLRR